MSDIERILSPILSEAVRVGCAEKGNIQLFDKSANALWIAAQRGFGRAFLTTFFRVNAESGCACGRAMKLRRYVIIDDVMTDEDYIPYRAAARMAEYRSVLSLPMISPQDELLGMISIHHSEPNALSAE